MVESFRLLKVEQLLIEMVEQQRKHLFVLGRRIVPTLTPEDILQPNDYVELENHAAFRYEEGVLAGLQGALAAVRALRGENDL